MSSFSELITNLGEQFGPALVIGLLLGVASLLGLIFGVSIASIIGSAARRRRQAAQAEELDLVQGLLSDSRQFTARLQAEHDTLRAKHNGIEAHAARQDNRVKQLTSELETAESLSRARQRELLTRSELGGDADLPTLIKRVPTETDPTPNHQDAGIIPDDQIIPTLPEAELTANVEAYDLSDLEDLVDQDS